LENLISLGSNKEPSLGETFIVKVLFYPLFSWLAHEVRKYEFLEVLNHLIKEQLF